MEAAAARKVDEAARTACVYVTDRVRRAVGTRWQQGAWRPALSLAARVSCADVALFARVRVHRVPREVACGLLAWAEGARDVALLDRVPTPREVLDFQAGGQRCVSLLADDALAAPHADGLAFVLHDLCHLEKFYDPEHRAGQLGFFARLARAVEGPTWQAFDRAYDEAWRKDWEHVAADMNG
jgi:hypothetical protein